MTVPGLLAPPAVDVVTDGPLHRVTVGGVVVATERRRSPADELAQTLRAEPGVAAELHRIATRHGRATP